jgi:hypothetical protein
MKYVSILGLSLMIIISCKDRRMISDVDDLNKTKNEIMRNYDYLELIRISNYFRDENYQDMLPYSLRLTDSVAFANYYFFKTYMEIRFEKNVAINQFSKLDKEEREFLLYILKKGARLGDISSIEQLILIYKDGIGVKQDTIMSDSLAKLLTIPFQY